MSVKALEKYDDIASGQGIPATHSTLTCKSSNVLGFRHSSCSVFLETIDQDAQAPEWTGQRPGGPSQEAPWQVGAPLCNRHE